MRYPLLLLAVLAAGPAPARDVCATGPVPRLEQDFDAETGRLVSEPLLTTACVRDEAGGGISIKNALLDWAWLPRERLAHAGVSLGANGAVYNDGPPRTFVELLPLLQRLALEARDSRSCYHLGRGTSAHRRLCVDVTGALPKAVTYYGPDVLAEPVLVTATELRAAGHGLLVGDDIGRYVDGERTRSLADAAGFARAAAVVDGLATARGARARRAGASAAALAGALSP